jgi:hypothetical protein
MTFSRLKTLFQLLIIPLIFILSCSEPNPLFPDSDKKIYQIEKGTSFGSTWELVYSIPTHFGRHTTYLEDVSCDQYGYIYVATGGEGIFKINPSFTGASVLKNGFIKYIIETDTIFYISALLYNNNRILAGSTDLMNFGSITYSDNGGFSFQSSIIWNKYSVVVSLYKSPNGDIFAGCYNDIFVSHNNGSSWKNILPQSNDNFGYFYSFAFDKYANIYGATRHGVYYSDSKELKFTNIGLGDETILGIDINSSGWIFASTEFGKMFYSADEGKSWKQIMNYPNYSALSIYINKHDFIFAGTTNGLFRSTDNGGIWELVGCENQSVQRIISDSLGNLIAGTYGSKIYYSFH